MRKMKDTVENVKPDDRTFPSEERIPPYWGEDLFSEDIFHCSDLRKH